MVLLTWDFVVVFSVALLQAIQKGNIDGARIHAENSIRQKNQVLLPPVFRPSFTDAVHWLCILYYHSMVLLFSF